MNEQIITCPSCKAPIKLNESLAAPLLEATRQEYEKRIAQKESDMTRREAAVRERQSEIEQAKETIDQKVATKLASERTKLAAREAEKARFMVATDLEQKTKELSDLREVLKSRDAKLAEAQQAQADLIRKQRELDDAKREMDPYSGEKGSGVVGGCTQ